MTCFADLEQALRDFEEAIRAATIAYENEVRQARENVLTLTQQQDREEIERAAELSRMVRDNMPLR